MAGLQINEFIKFLPPSEWTEKRYVLPYYGHHTIEEAELLAPYYRAELEKTIARKDQAKRQLRKLTDSAARDEKMKTLQCLGTEINNDRRHRDVWEEWIERDREVSAKLEARKLVSERGSSEDTADTVPKSVRSLPGRKLYGTPNFNITGTEEAEERGEELKEKVAAVRMELDEVKCQRRKIRNIDYKKWMAMEGDVERLRRELNQAQHQLSLWENLTKRKKAEQKAQRQRNMEAEAETLTGQYAALLWKEGTAAVEERVEKDRMETNVQVNALKKEQDEVNAELKLNSFGTGEVEASKEQTKGLRQRLSEITEQLTACAKRLEECIVPKPMLL